jgi:hypothetical protein
MAYMLIFSVSGSLHTLKLIIPGYISPGLFVNFHLLNIAILSIEYLPVLLFIANYFWLMTNHRHILSRFLSHRGVQPVLYYSAVILISSMLFFSLSLILRHTTIPVTGNAGYQAFKKSLFLDILNSPEKYIGNDLRKLGPYFISAEKVEEIDSSIIATNIHILSSRNQGGIKEVDSIANCAFVSVNQSNETIQVKECSVFSSSIQALDQMNFIHGAVYNMEDLYEQVNNEKNNVSIARLLPVYIAKYIDAPNLNRYFCTKPVLWTMDNQLFYLAFFLMGMAAIASSWLLSNFSYFVQMVIVIFSAFYIPSFADILQIYTGRIDTVFHLRYSVPNFISIIIILFFITRYYLLPSKERI